MNWIDYIIFGLIALSACMGFMRGFVKEVLSLVTLIVAFWVSTNFHMEVAVFLTKIQDDMIRNGVSMVILFVITLLIGAALNHIIGLLVAKTGLSGTNSLLGIVFGGVRGIILVSAMLFFIDAFTPLSNSVEWRNAQLIPHFDGVIQWFFRHLEQFSSFIKMPSNI